jgi:hypothetical protein
MEMAGQLSRRHSLTDFGAPYALSVILSDLDSQPR